MKELEKKMLEAVLNAMVAYIAKILAEAAKKIIEQVMKEAEEAKEG